MTLAEVLVKDLENKLDEVKNYIQTHKTVIPEEEKAVLMEMIVRFEYNVRDTYDIDSPIYLTTVAKVVKERCNMLEVKKNEL